MTNHFYVWYRIDGDEAECERSVRGMMARLACRTGVPGRLLRKHGEPRLWMEAYVDVAEPEAFQARLRQAVDEYDIEMFIDGPRHTERFLGDAPVPAVCQPPLDTRA